MVKQAKSEPESQTDSVSGQRRLRSSGPLLAEPIAEQPPIKRPSLIGDKELDEARIVHEFQVKRKMLMKILKEKQRLKVSNPEPFQVKEGMLQFHDSESQVQSSNSVNQDGEFLVQDEVQNPNSGIQNQFQKQNAELPSMQSEKIEIGIQTEQTTEKKPVGLRPFKQQTKTVPQTHKRISKQAGNKMKTKKTKKTNEDIQRLKKQINLLLSTKQTQVESSQEHSSMCQSVLSIMSGGTNEEYLMEVGLMINKLNQEIETYYQSRKVKEVVLNQCKARYNRRKYEKSARSFSDNRSVDEDKFAALDFFQVQELKEKNRGHAVQQNGKNNHNIQKPKYQPEQGNDSNKSKTKKQKQKTNRGLLNERFPIFADDASEPIKTQILKSQSSCNSIKNQPALQKTNGMKDSDEEKFENSDFYKSHESYFDDETQISAQIQHSRAWVKEFDIQVQIIYEKFPKLRKYQLTRKFESSENKQMQIDDIEGYCDKKTKKIAKKFKRYKRSDPKPKSFKEKIETISKKKTNQDNSFTSEKEKNRIFQMKNLPKLKELQIQSEDDEWNKSFDHRSRRGQVFAESASSRVGSRVMRDSELQDNIYDVLKQENDFDRSHEFYFSSGSEGAFKMKNERKSLKLENKRDQVGGNLSKSHVETSSDFSGQKQVVKKNNDSSFFKSEESNNEYFNMSGDNPLKFCQ